MSEIELVQLNGECMLPSAQSIRSTLLRHLAAGQATEIDLSKVDRVDLSFIQLVVSAARSAAEANQPFALSGFNDDVAIAFSLAGLDITDPAALGTLSQGH